MRLALCTGCVVALAFVAASAAAQQYPDKVVRVIVPYSAGGGADVIARMNARRMSETWGQPVVVENRVGAGGIIGKDLVAKAPPDGYTIGLFSNTHAIVPAMYKLPYDPINHFAPITVAAIGLNIVVVHPSLPARSVKELIAFAKTRPGQITFGSAGVGTTTHLAGELFMSMAGITLVHVPYKGSSQSQIDLVAGQISMMVDSALSALQHVKAGQIRALAVTSSKRSQLTPDLPTVAESGVPGYEFITWWGLFAPAKTPTEIVNKWVAEVTRIVNLPEVKEFYAKQGIEPLTRTPAQFTEYIKTEIEKYGKTVRDAKIKVE